MLEIFWDIVRGSRSLGCALKGIVGLVTVSLLHFGNEVKCCPLACLPLWAASEHGALGACTLLLQFTAFCGYQTAS